MANQLIVNVTPFETRIALLENNAVVEMQIERKKEKGIVGNIYLGRVQRVLPGMQAAFVELGLDKAAFLYVGDVISPDIVDFDDEPEPAHPSDAPETPDVVDNLEVLPRRKRPMQRIEDLLKGGQEILVQVTKDPIGTKGPRVTCQISIPGRHIVFMPTCDHVGVSRKIIDDEERERLKRILTEAKPVGGGFVARTVAQKVAEEKLKADAAYLISLWQTVVARSQKLKAPCLVQPELDLFLRCARDMTNENLEKIVVDDGQAFERGKSFLELLDTKLIERIERYLGAEPIFESFGIEAEILRAMARKVWLKSGGYLVIDQAEALTVVDVNTGRFVGKRNLDETILRTNLEAVREVAYQLRLRNIGGMVIIDFIDMESQGDRDKVLTALIEALRKDKARCNVVKMSELGLVEMTRQRTTESLERHLCEPCFYCDGRGMLKSKTTVAYEIFRVLLQKTATFTEPAIIVHAHPEVIDLICGEEQETLAAIESQVNRQIIVKPRGSFHQEQFDVFGSKNTNESNRLNF